MSTLIKERDEINSPPNKDEMENATVTLYAVCKKSNCRHIRVISCNDGDINKVTGFQLNKFIEELWAKGYDPVDLSILVKFGVL